MADDEPDKTLGVKTFLKVIKFAAPILRKVGLRAPIRAVKHQVTHSLLQNLHENVIHRMRTLAIAMDRWNPAASQTVAIASHELATEFRKSMGGLIDLGDNELHCCLKVIDRPKASRTNNLTSLLGSILLG